MLDLVLDSGAFTAWTKKTEVDLDAYIRYIKEHSEFFDHAVNLDMIPGEFGRVPTPVEVEASAQRGWDNMLFMEEFGIKPMPVFHMGETFDWLRRMIDHGCDYIGISPANDRTTQQKQLWLDQVFSMITDDEGWPIIKTHGFGVTSVPILFRYPWYSADSTSWMLFGAYGMILVPQWGRNGFRYDISPHSIVVSAESKQKQFEGKHFESFGASTQEHIRAYVEACGTTMEAVQTDYLGRALVNAKFFKDVSEKMPAHPFKMHKRDLFQCAPAKAYSNRPPYKGTGTGMKIIFATNDSHQPATILNRLEIKHRLLSYYYIRDNPKDFLEVYTRDGIYFKSKNRKKVKNVRKQLD